MCSYLYVRFFFFLLLLLSGFASSVFASVLQCEWEVGGWVLGGGTASYWMFVIVHLAAGAAEDK